MKLQAFRYYSPLIVYAGALQSFSSVGFVCYLPLVYAWIIIPTLELISKPDAANLEATEEAIAREDKTYDLILYLIVLLQVAILVYFLFSLRDPNLGWVDIVGRTGSMGLLCGTFGINVGHELGHRTKQFETVLARISLLTSLYMHFYIEHNRGHHKNVATPHDPSSARFGESVYLFWIRSIVYSYLSAWKISNRDQRKKGKPAISLSNEMVLYQLIQLMLVIAIGVVFGWKVLGCFLAAAAMGILLLETVNYIEHYGLTRKQLDTEKFERARPEHSWNSNHVIGRVMLFELSRHSDHHYLASRKYQLLRHHDTAPQMPTGYPGMMILSLIPPAWFHVMNRKISEIQQLNDVPVSYPASVS